MAAATSREALTPQATATTYAERGMEVLWLLTAALVPFIFVPTDFMLSEAVNAYVEVPKTTTLRILAGMMTILWIVEWVLKGGLTRQYSLARYLTRLRNWLVERPSRWVVIAATAYVVVAIITTFLSQAPWISLWGEVSAQYGYSSYTTVSYFMVFAVITTHVKTRVQLWRLLGVILGTGAAVALYGMMQHYCLDPFDLGEGGCIRVSATMANPVFTGAALVTTTVLTLGLGLTLLNSLGWAPFRVILWVCLIAAQFLAVYWTGSRGSWLLGVPAGVLAFLVLFPIVTASRDWVRDRALPLDMVGLLGLLVLLGMLTLLAPLDLLDLWDLPGLPDMRILLGFLGLLGWLSLIVVLLPGQFSSGVRAFAKTFLVTGSAFLIALLVITLTPASDGTPTLDLKDLGGLPDLRILMAILLPLGLLGLLIFQFPSRFSLRVHDLAKSLLVLSSVLLIALLVVGLTATTAGTAGDGDSATGISQVGGDSATEAQQELASAGSVVTTKKLSYRDKIWEAGGGLILNRPWFEYEELSFSSVGPLGGARFFIGYGPEMFKYTFPLESSLGGLLSHSHNFWLHHWVEQGFLGFLSSLGLFIAFFVVGAAQLWRNWGTYSTAHRWILVTLLATIAGRSVEMMVGVARESDLITFWILLAIFVVLPSVMSSSGEPETSAASGGTPRPLSRRERRIARASGRERHARRLSGGIGGASQAGALVVVSALVIFIGWLTWDKNVDYAWAAIIAAEARDAANEGNLQEGQRLFKQASAKAPDVPNYYHSLTALYEAYRKEEIKPERELPPCAEYFGLDPGEIPGGRSRCAEEAYVSSFQGHGKNSTSPQSKIVLAGATFRLAGLGYEGRGEEAVRYYSELTQMLPLQPHLRNALADVYLRLNRPGEAVDVLEKAETQFPDSPSAAGARRLLVDGYNAVAVIHLQQQESEAALESLEKALALTEGSPNSGKVLYLQGVAYRQLNEPQKAMDAFERSLAMDVNGPLNAETLLGRPQQALESLETFLATSEDPAQSALAYYLQGLAYRQLDEMEKAADAFERSLAPAGDSPYVSEFRRRLVDAYDGQSVAYLQQDGHSEALTVLEKYVALTEGSGASARPLFLQGVAYRQLEQWEEAVDSLKQSLAADAESRNAADAQRLLENIYIASGD